MTPSDQGKDGGPDPQERGPTGPVIRDKRRVDPVTGEVRTPAGSGAPAAEAPAAEEPGTGTEQVPSEDAEATILVEGDDVGTNDDHPDSVVAAQRLEDLRRLQAEFVNYKRRVDRDRARDKEVAVGGVVEALLPVLDDIHLAREHGDLGDGPFVAIAEKLAVTLGRYGVEQFGQVGDVFDPAEHEALMHLPEADLPESATATTVVQVMQPGFRVGERVVRPARVAVADPA